MNARFRRSYYLIFSILVFGAFDTAWAQFGGFQCPAGSRPVSGGGGLMCRCPDGSFASMYGCKQQRAQPRTVGKPIDIGRPTPSTSQSNTSWTNAPIGRPVDIGQPNSFGSQPNSSRTDATLAVQGAARAVIQELNNIGAALQHAQKVQQTLPQGVSLSQFLSNAICIDATRGNELCNVPSISKAGTSGELPTFPITPSAPTQAISPSQASGMVSAPSGSTSSASPSPQEILDSQVASLRQQVGTLSPPAGSGPAGTAMTPSNPTPGSCGYSGELCKSTFTGFDGDPNIIKTLPGYGFPDITYQIMPDGTFKPIR